MDTNDQQTKAACTDFLKMEVRQLRYWLKKKYFDGIPANQIRIASPVASMSNDQWIQLVQMWSDPRKRVCESTPSI